MKYKSFSKPYYLFTYIFIFIIFMGLPLGVWTLSARTTQDSEQGRIKVIEQAFSSNPQIRVTRIKAGQRNRQLNEKFDDDDDWLKKLSVQLENTSGKTIVYLQVNFNFPETKTSGNLMSYPIILGRKPGSQRVSHNDPLLFLPGGTIEISLNEHYNKLTKFIGTRHLPKLIRKAQLEIGFIVFEDGTGWSAGHFYRQDPNNPDRYINVGTSLPN
jgi:hypothetical protein